MHMYTLTVRWFQSQFIFEIKQDLVEDDSNSRIRNNSLKILAEWWFKQ